MRTTLVVAVGENGVIGRDGQMPWPTTGDQRQFKELTLGHPLVMGRTTFESIGRPLPGRTSIVLTRDPAWGAEGVLVASSVPAALEQAARLDGEVFVIGGAQVYAAVLEAGLADRIVLTRVHQSPQGDTWFPLTDLEGWREVAREAHEGYDVVTYDRETSQR